MGRELFSDELTHAKIAQLLSQDWQFKTTKLSTEFTYEDFQSRYPANHVLAVITEQGKPLPVTGDSDAVRLAGNANSIIALVRATEQPEDSSLESV